MQTFATAKALLVVLFCAFISCGFVREQDTYTKSWTQRDGISISEVNVLLPFPTHESVTTFPLGVAGGCFDWHSTDDSILKIKVLQNTCGRNVTLIPSETMIKRNESPNGRKRESARAVAVEKHTGAQIYCDVSFDQVSRVEIETTTKTVVKEDHEILELAGFDSTGNKFSSLIGVPVEWETKPISFVSINGEQAAQTQTKTKQSILDIIPFTGSIVDTLPEILRLETNGKRGSIVLVRGNNLGNATITARCEEKQTEVVMSVIQPLMLDPSYSLTVLPGTVFNYKLYTKHNRQPYPLTIPSQAYIWESTDSSIATVNDSGLVKTRELGNAKISVSMREMPESRTRGSIIVINDVSLNLDLYQVEEGKETYKLPSKGPWRVVVNKKYRLHLTPVPRPLYGDTLHFTHLAQYRVDSGIITGEVVNATASVEPFDRGQFIINGALVKNGIYRFPAPVKASHAVIVDDQVTVTPDDVAMLYLENERHTGKLIAKGGSGEYLWEIDRSKSATSAAPVIALSDEGLVTALLPGIATVKVLDKHNKQNYAFANITVFAAGTLKTVTNTSEVFVGDNILASAYAYALENTDKGRTVGRRINFCDRLPLEWSTNEKVLDILDKAPEDKESAIKPCSSVILRGANVGSAAASAQIKQRQYYEYRSNKVVSSEAHLFVHRPLSFVKDEGIPVIALGSSYEIQIKDGPTPWYSDNSLFGFTTANKNSFEGDADAKDVQQSFKLRNTSPVLISTRVTCRTLGLHQVVLSTANKKCVENPVPVQSSIVISFDCQVPADMKLNVAGDAEPTSDCPGVGVAFPENQYSVLRTQSRRDVSVSLLDARGRTFVNASSVEINWTTTDAKLASFSGASSWKKLLSVFDNPGTAKLSIRAVGYITQHLKSAGVKNFDHQRFAPFGKEAQLAVVENVQLSLDKERLFNHPLDEGMLTISGGSGKYSYGAEPANSYEYSKVIELGKIRDNQIPLVPVNAGTAKVFVKDRCFTEMPAAEKKVSVKELRSIQLYFSHTVLAVGAPVEALCELYDTDGLAIPSKWVNVLSPKLEVEGGLLSVAKIEEDRCFFTATGATSGKGAAKIHVRSNDGRDVESNAVQVEVYTPFTIEPSFTSVLMGADAKLTFSGGPKYALKKYIVHGNSTAVVLPQAVSTEALTSYTVKTVGSGFAKVTVALYPIYTADDINQQEAIKSKAFSIVPPRNYGEASAVLSITPMTGLKIRSNIAIMKEEANTCQGSVLVPSNNEVKLMLEGESGESAVDLSLLMGLQVRWRVSNPAVAKLRQLNQQDLSAELVSTSFGVLLHSLAVGSVTVTATIEGAKNDLFTRAYSKMSTSVTMSVVPALSLRSPSVVRLAQGAKYAIKTTRDETGFGHSLKYDVISADKDRSTAMDDDSDLVRLLPGGVIAASSTATGTAFVRVTDTFAEDSTTPLVVTIRVEVPKQLQLLPPQGFTHLGVGDTTTFSIVLRDKWGQPLVAPDMKALKVTQASDGEKIVAFAVNPSHAGLSVQGLKQGTVALRAALGNTDLQDMVQVQIGTLVAPVDPVVLLGGEVCFSYKKASPSGVWSSANPSVFAIDPTTGCGKAHSLGATVVKFVGNSDKGEAVVTVTDLASVEAYPNGLAKRGSKRYYYAGLKYRTAQGTLLNLGSTAIKHNLHISCDSTTAGVIASGNDCLIPRSAEDVKLRVTATVYGKRKTFESDVSYHPPFEVLHESEYVLLSPGKAVQVSVENCSPSFRVTSSSPDVEVNVVQQSAASKSRIVHITPRETFTPGQEVNLIFEDVAANVQTILKGTTDTTKGKAATAATSSTSEGTQETFVPLEPSSTSGLLKILVVLIIFGIILAIFLMRD